MCEMMLCPSCHGEGKILGTNRDGMLVYTTEYPCPLCHSEHFGKGELEGMSIIPSEWFKSYKLDGMDGLCDVCGKERACAWMDRGARFVCAGCFARLKEQEERDNALPVIGARKRGDARLFRFTEDGKPIE